MLGCGPLDREPEAHNLSGQVVPATPSLHWSFKLVWLLFTVSCNTSITVTLGYIILSYSSTHYKAILTTSNIHICILNSVIIIFELCMTTIPVKFCQFVFVDVFGIVYVILTLFNTFVFGNENAVYTKLLDWKHNPGYSVLSVLIVLIFWIPLVQCSIVLIHLLKNVIFRKLYNIDST